MEHLIFEIGLALVFIAVAAAIAARLRLSVVPLLILLGLAVGPHAPHIGVLDLRFIQSEPLIQFMGRLGVLFLLFYLGLEFSLGRLIRARRSIATAGAIYLAINLTLGLLFGWLVGWPVREVLVVAGVITISSSAIVAKVIVDLKRSARPETELILGIMMVQDVFLAVYMAVISGVVLKGSISAGGVAGTVAIAVLFLAAFLTLGRRVAGHLNRWLDIPSDEVFLLLIFAALFTVAGVSEVLGVAEAIGALLLGLVLAETAQVRRIQRLVIPFRDFFGALFFFSFGLSIDATALGGAVGLALVAVGLTLVGNFAAGLILGRVSRLPTRDGVNIGLTILSRGEFSIVLASLARSGGLLPILQPFTAVYVLVLSILGPILTRESGAVYGGLTKVLRIVRRKALQSSATPKDDTGTSG